jgi:hypothetical protein
MALSWTVLLDHGWRPGLPAGTVRTRLTAQPDLLTGRRCQLDWVWAAAREPSQLRFTFTYPQQPDLPDAEPWLQFEQVIPIDATPATHQAARIVRQLETVDPKTRATVVGGTRDHAERLGYAWPERGR